MTNSVDSSSGALVWVIGTRYRLLDATASEQVAQGTEEKMEIGAKQTSVAGISNAAAGGISLHRRVQRLVQESIWDIDTEIKKRTIASNMGGYPSTQTVTHAIAARAKKWQSCQRTHFCTGAEP